MAEKNTLSILESIRKKIQKLDEPRKADNKDFSDIGDEFDYVAPAKKNAPVQAVEEASPANPAPIKTDNAIEHEITESFEIDEEQEAEQPAPEEPVAQEVEAEEADINFDLDEDNAAEKEVEPIEAASVPAENTAEPVEEDEDLFEFDDDDSAEEMPDLEDDDLELDSETSDKADEELEEAVQPEEQVEKSDEDELEDLLKQEGSVKIEEVKVAPVNPSAPVVPMATLPPEPIKSAIYIPIPEVQSVSPSQPQVTDSAKKTFTNVNESLLDKQAATNITDSIKKLIDAKNAISGVTSFSKSEAFADIAAQLMEPRLEKWLNENLPSLVEKIVRDEIKKIIPKE